VAGEFGYPEAALPEGRLSEAKTPADVGMAGSFLKREELPNGATLGLFAVRVARVGEQPLYVIGGERLDQGFLFDARHPRRNAGIALFKTLPQNGIRGRCLI